MMTKAKCYALQREETLKTQTQNAEEKGLKRIAPINHSYNFKFPDNKMKQII